MATLRGYADTEEDSTETPSAPAEEQPQALPVGLSVKLDISRRRFKNFLTDETALLPYVAHASGTSDEPANFLGAFSIGSPKARFAVIWDPTSCRIVGVLDLHGSPDSTEAPGSPYRLLAEGSPPTAALSGASGQPEYFGMRVVDGKPEFLYTHGSVAVAEKIWLEDAGNVLKQQFTFKKERKQLKLRFPKEWAPFMQASAGTWKDGALTIDGEALTEVTLLYQLDPPVPTESPTEPEESEE